MRRDSQVEYEEMEKFGIQLDDEFLIVDNLKSVRGLTEEIRLAEGG